MERRFSPNYLSLSPGEDDKKWVAEITGPDPKFRFKRVFLPEFEPGLYEIHDGLYQIHGLHPGITPYKKEYCMVNRGHMERRVPYGSVIEALPYIQAYEPQRQERIREQITYILNQIKKELDHELVNEDISYMQENLQDLNDSQVLTETLSQLLKRKDSMIKQYQQRLKNYHHYWD